MKFQIEKDSRLRHGIAVQSLMCLAWTKFGGYMTKLSSQKFHDLDLAGSRNPDYESHCKSSQHHFQSWKQTIGKPAGYWMPYGCIIELCCSIYDHSLQKNGTDPDTYFDSAYSASFTDDQITFAHKVISFLRSCRYSSVIRSRPVDLSNTAQRFGFMTGSRHNDYQIFSIESSNPPFDIQIPLHKSILYPLESCYITAILFKISMYDDLNSFITRYFSR